MKPTIKFFIISILHKLKKYHWYKHPLFLCGLSLILTYLVACILPLNSWIDSGLKGPDYLTYQLFNITTLLLLFTFYCWKKKVVQKRFLEIILIGILIGYITSLFSILCTSVLSSFYGYAKWKGLINFFIEEPFNAMVASLALPIYILGWLYGAIMGIIIYLLGRLLNKANKSSDYEM